MDEDRKTVFLVDDVDFSLVRTKQFLKDYYTVFTLNSANKMFVLLDKVRPDLILLDINMPDINGYEAIQIIKADERFADIPVVFLSGKDDEESIIKGIGLGAVDHVTKPYTPKALLASISKHIHQTEYQQELHIDQDKNVSKQTILAVDDSPSMLRSIHFTLRNHYKVHTLQKPEKLQSIVKSLMPDLFLLDYNMPEINGLELVKIIREFPDFKETPIVLLTSDSTKEHLNEAINLDVNGYMLKPFNPRKLREKIARCLAKTPD